MCSAGITPKWIIWSSATQLKLYLPVQTFADMSNIFRLSSICWVTAFVIRYNGHLSSTKFLSHVHQEGATDSLLVAAELCVRRVRKQNDGLFQHLCCFGHAGVMFLPSKSSIRVNIKLSAVPFIYWACGID